MKWDCGETSLEKYDRIRKWHRWFAWRPVRVGSHDCRWLEYVERKLCVYWYDYGWKYRALPGFSTFTNEDEEKP